MKIARPMFASMTMLVMTALCLVGCVDKLPPSPVQTVCDPVKEGVSDPIAKTRPTSNDPHIFPIRLTDDGQFVSRCELTDALLELRTEDPHLVVVYIHGWKHDARPGDSDLNNLGGLLKRLDQAQSTLAVHRQVIGIYIAWNGATLSAPVLNNLTFWGRKKAADLIAHSAMVTKIVSSIDGIERKRRAAQPKVNDVTIYAGHSFGARMLYSAVSQVMIHDVELDHPDTLQGRVGTNVNTPLPPDVRYSSIPGFGDLVLLLNPAFEASFYQSFQTLIRPGAGQAPREKFNSRQQPLMMTLSATNDWATGWAFPAGQSAAFNFNVLRRRTLGNYAPALTHQLGDATGQPTPSRTSGEFWYDDFCSAQICLQRLTGIPETGDPFIVAQAPATIIDGHNGIWQPNLQDFLTRFISEVIRRRDATD